MLMTDVGLIRNVVPPWKGCAAAPLPSRGGAGVGSVYIHSAYGGGRLLNLKPSFPLVLAENR